MTADDLNTNDIWTLCSVEELAREHLAAPVTDIHALTMPDWPDDESAEDLINYTYSQRRADLACSARRQGL